MTRVRSRIRGFVVMLAVTAGIGIVAACGTASAPNLGAGGSKPIAGSSSSESQGSSGAGGELGIDAGGSWGNDSGSDAGCGMQPISACQTDTDCDDGDPTTTDVCTVESAGSEFPTRVCLHIACDGGAECAMQAVDPGCSVADAGVVYPPSIPVAPPDVPQDCKSGLEICDAKGAPNYVIHSKSSMGSRGITLDLDFATYTAPDGLLITAVGLDCKPYILFDTCRVKTSGKAESSYTNGMMRPKDEAIRQFHLDLHPGTTELTFDFSRVVSPMYVRVLGLCDFELPSAAGVGWFSLDP